MKFKDNLNGRKISVLGAGVSGRALALLAKRLGADVFVSDSAAVSSETADLFRGAGIEWESNGNTEKLLECGEIVVSSGISPDAEILVNAAAKNVPVVGELDFVCPYLNGKIIAVTGSNGKTTTTSMIGYFLEKMGYKCSVGGNIGSAVADAAGEEYDFIVLELSSFQLFWAKKLCVDVAVVTNLAPDHIDWHGSYENYVEAKAKLTGSLKDGGAAIYQKRDENALLIPRNAVVLPLQWGAPEASGGIYMDGKSSSAWLSLDEKKTKLFDFDAVKLLGSHNLENTAMAAAALGRFAISVTDDAISAYEPPSHRCAYVGTLNGITFVDDSKGTNVAATVAAMSSLPDKKIMILGGKGKGEDYAPLAEAVVKYAVWAVLIGAEKEKIAKALDSAGYSSYTTVSDMSEAVRAAYEKASGGETVLLSPACTSWDMYPNYGARGEHFAALVKELIDKEA